MATPPVIDQEYVQLKQQMVKLQRKIKHFERKKPELLTIELNTTDSNWAMFMDVWGLVQGNVWIDQPSRDS